MNTDALPSLPAGQRWQKKRKRTWVFLALQRQTWYGWKTLKVMSINPKGMTYEQALISTAHDILDGVVRA